MYTYTHLAVGMVIGKFLFPENFNAQLWVITGAVMPDIATVSKLILDKVRGKQGLKDVGKLYWLTTNCSHSFIIWPFLFIIYLPLFVGVYSHLICDLLSHKKIDGFGNPNWIWPLPWEGKIEFGLFDFRRDWKGEVKLLPSLPEAIILLMIGGIYFIF